nr:MAG: cell-to-cell movement protein [Pastinaca umbravirus 1]UVK78473.1 MAG: cell-to-cell movement protein [Pastinaca umbravirus 1]
MELSKTATTTGELINLLHGEATVDELRELGLGVMTPVRGNNTLTHTPLYPPRRQLSLSRIFSGRWRTKRTGGMLFIEKLVIVFVPHVPDTVGGEAVIWVHDTALPGLEPIGVGQKVCIPLSTGPRLVAFYPNYSIPLSDSAMNAPRCFSLVTQLEGVRLEPGASAFSLYSMWQPVIEERAQSYLPTPPEDVAIQRHHIISQLRDLSQRTRYLHAAMTNEVGTSARGSQSMRYPPLTFAEKCTQRVIPAQGRLQFATDNHPPQEEGVEPGNNKPGPGQS